MVMTTTKSKMLEEIEDDDKFEERGQVQSEKKQNQIWIWSPDLRYLNLQSQERADCAVAIDKRIVVGRSEDHSTLLRACCHVGPFVVTEPPWKKE